MNYKSLGNTQLQLPEIGCGGASFGNLFKECTVDDIEEAVFFCLNHGIHYFDTAPKYGNGLSERRLGDALRQYTRDSFIISSKVGINLTASHNLTPEPDKFINKLPFHRTYNYSYGGILKSFENSLQRLGMNQIDILFVHELDRTYLGDHAFEHHFKEFIRSGYRALDHLRSSGVIKAFGFGVRDWRACAQAMQFGEYDCFMLAGSYHLLNQDAKMFLDDCAQRKISILQAGPFASGILATGAIDNSYYHHELADDSIKTYTNRWMEYCSARGIPLQAAAIQFPLTHPAVVSTVIGFRNIDECQQAIQWYETSIGDQFFHEAKMHNLIKTN